METYHAIEIIGYGTKRRYIIREVVREGKFGPVHAWSIEPPYRTEESAREAAKANGIEIKKVGDFYQII